MAGCWVCFSCMVLTLVIFFSCVLCSVSFLIPRFFVLLPFTIALFSFYFTYAYRSFDQLSNSDDVTCYIVTCYIVALEGVFRIQYIGAAFVWPPFLLFRTSID